MEPKTQHPDEVAITRQADRIELNMLSDPATLRPVRLAGEEFCRQSGLSVKESEEIGLAVNEAIANVMRHQYHGDPTRPIRVTFSRQDGQVKIEIRDWGKPFDPAKLPKGEVRSPDPDQIKPGGLGLICLRKLLDRVEFIPQKDGTLLTMSKKIGSLQK
ncbi:MAG TPA: ATP-binding protein [Tepidisphaeraceae bacterium]|nr:ATP-binding protein [Tepidisphaeraceae bacterium]